MSARRRLVLGVLTAIALVAATSPRTRAFSTLGSTWANGTVTMHMQLGSGSGTLINGATSWNQAATSALATWNNHIQLVRFSAVQDSTVPNGDGDLINHSIFASTVYGEAFPEDTLAITTRWTRNRTERVEGDVVFNTAYRWNAYSGPLRSGVWDIVRVALHEYGHVLGLDHPDEHGQSVTALMNSIIGNLDSLATDDINGVRSLYGAGITSNITFPPRNETNDFFRQLVGVYRDELRAAAETTYIDDEGKVVWIAEYTYYRVGQCDHPTAQSRVFTQILNQIAYGVCALTPAGAIPFPPRGEGLQFMVATDDVYRNQLGRSALTSFVNNEGAVVWVMEYLRYRLNGCNHGDAVSRVLAQIRGQGIQPVCRA